jgi:beta-glucanase (GH16 family)
MLWSDEFSGTSLDTSKWAVSAGPRRDAVNTPAAISVAGGYLTVTTYTSGGTHYTGFLGTSNGFRATYGYWEARVAFQDSPGMWSAFWDQSPTIGNPLGNPAVAGTEVDTVEHRATDGTSDISNKAESNIHWDGYGSSEHSAGSGLENNPGGVSLQGNFHLYALQWSPAGYQFYIDDTPVWSTTQAVSHRSEFIYLSSEVQNNSWAGRIPGGGYGSLAASQTKMIVDYVRVWQKPVAGLSDRTTTEGTATPALPFNVTQQDGRTTNVSATSSNTYLVPDGSLTLGGGGADRTLTAAPAAGQTGYATVTISANNGTVGGGGTFTLTVNAASFHNGGFEDDAAGTGWNRYGGAQVVSGGQRSGSRAMRISGYGGAEQVVTGLSPDTTYTLGGYARVTRAGTPALIGVKNYGGPERATTVTSTSYTRGTVSFTTGPDSTQATVYVYKPTSTDDGYFDDVYVFRAPTFSAIAAQLVNANTTSAPVPFTVGNVSSAAGAWAVTATSSDQALVPNDGIVVGGSGPDPNLTITPARGQTGTATITVTVTDSDGGSATRQFPVTVVNQVGGVGDGTPFSGGLDGNGYAYSAKLLGPAVTAGGVDFDLGAAGGTNAVRAAGQTLALPAGAFSALTFLGTAVNGAQPGLTFTVNYTDGTGDIFTQDMSDWQNPQGYAGEAAAAALSYVNYADGSSPAVPNYLYRYTFALNNQKTVSSITLPGNGNVLMPALDLLA